MTNKSRLLRNLAIIMAIVGFLAISPIGQAIYVMGLISVIGIPVSMVIFALPVCAMIFVSSYLLWRFVYPFNRLTILVSGLMTCVLMFLLPLIHNLQVNHAVARLGSGDVVNANTPSELNIFGKRLALVSKSRRAMVCDDMCLHLLMSNQASSVLKARLDKDENYPQFDVQTFEYTLEPMSECPQFPVRGMGASPNSINLKNRTKGSVAAQYADRLEQGYCLIGRETEISKADYIFLALDQRELVSPSTLSPFNNDISAYRSGIYRYDEAENMLTFWQKTAVTYSMLKPVLMPIINVPAGLSGTRAGLWREDKRIDKSGYSRLRDLLRAAGISLPEELK